MTGSRRLLRIPRGGLSGLTTRGRSFFAAGIAASIVAVLLGQPDILRVGILLVAVPLISALMVTRSQYRLACSRRIDPPRIAAGDTAIVGLRLDNVSRIPTGLLLAEDRVPYVLGSRPRFVLDRVEPQGTRSVGYQVRSDVRGRFSIGPLGVRLTDPFGMCELQRSFTATDSLTVTPVVTPLPAINLSGMLAGSGNSSARAVAAAGDDDVSTREYRHGDALHRVHWRSSARRGELMVRREEQPWQSRATLLLDTRALAHRGEGPSSSFEQAVSVTASVGAHLCDRGYAVRMFVEDDEAGTREPALHATGAGLRGTDSRAAILDSLAVVSPSGRADFTPSGLGPRALGEGLLVAVLGALTPREAQELARMPQAFGSRRAAVAIIVDTSSWSAVGSRDSDRDAVEDAAALLRSAGWRATVLEPGEDVTVAWNRLGAGVVSRRGGAA